jgi:hypothetical protein
MHFTLLALLGAVTLAPSCARAAPVAAPALPLHEAVQHRAELVPLEPLAPPQPSFGTTVSRATLDAQRGGTDTVNNNMQLGGSVQDNVANNVVTGANSIDAGSFANMSGIPTVIQNTGANVLIQNATIINLQFK